MRRFLVLALLALASCGLEVVGTGTSESERVVSPEMNGGEPSTQADESTSHDIQPSDQKLACTADIATDLAHCGGCDMPCPEGSNACIDGKCYASLHVTAKIGGESDLVIKGETVQWFHGEDAPPVDTTLNGVTFTPTWPAGKNLGECNCLSTNSMSLVPPLPARAQQVKLEQHKGRANVGLRQPTDRNGYELRVRFEEENAPVVYDLTITYETR